MLEFAILGPLEVRADGQPVELPGSASRRVLAALAVGYGEWLSADRLIDEVWGERPPEAARKALQTHIWRLRRALAAAVPDPECVLASGPAGYRLDLTAGQLDAVRFERLVEAARSAHAASEPVEGAGVAGRGAGSMARAAVGRTVAGGRDGGGARAA